MTEHELNLFFPAKVNLKNISDHTINIEGFSGDKGSTIAVAMDGNIKSMETYVLRLSNRNFNAIKEQKFLILENCKDGEHIIRQGESIYQKIVSHELETTMFIKSQCED